MAKNFYWVNLYGYDGDGGSMRIYTDSEDKAYQLAHDYAPFYTHEVVKEDRDNLTDTFTRNTIDGVITRPYRNFRVYKHYKRDGEKVKLFSTYQFINEKQIREYAEIQCEISNCDMVFHFSDSRKLSKIIYVYS